MEKGNVKVQMCLVLEEKYRDLIRAKSKAHGKNMTRYIIDLVLNDNRPTVDEQISEQEKALKSLTYKTYK